MKMFFRAVMLCVLTIGLMNLSASHCLAQVAKSQSPVLASQTDPSRKDPSQAAHDQADHDATGETVSFSLPQWKTMHFEDAAKATQHADTVKKLGCEVKQGQHAGHIDLTYRCVEWKSMTVKSHELAEQWIGWLKGSGFDVSHAHVDAAYAAGKEAVQFRLASWKNVHGKGAAEEKQLIGALKKLGCEVQVIPHGGHSDIKFRAPTWRDVHVSDQAVAYELQAWLKQYGFEVAAR